MPILAGLKGVGLFFWRNPWAAMALIIAVGWGVMKWQGYRIDGLKLENDRLSVIIKSERQHNERVVKAFEDKGAKDHDREEFVRKATAEAAGKRSALPPAPALSDAYSRVYERASARTAKDTR